MSHTIAPARPKPDLTPEAIAAPAGVPDAARSGDPKAFVIFPGSGGVSWQIEQPDVRLGGESIAAVFQSVGVQVRPSWWNAEDFGV